MSIRAQDWMAAAACSEGPRPAVTFADLPRRHQGELVRYGLVAAASTAYFITLAILAQPLPSRNLLADTVLPDAPPPRSVALEARVTQIALVTAAPRPHHARSRPAAALAIQRDPAGGAPPTAPTPRRNLFSRFFRGVLHTVAPD